METAVDEPKRQLVRVTLGVTTDDGQTEVVEKQIESGPTQVATLKAELGVPQDSSLWVLAKNGKKMRQCVGCRRWITTTSCDHCWVDQHQCPPTVAELRRLIEDAETIAPTVARLRRQLDDALRATAPHKRPRSA